MVKIKDKEFVPFVDEEELDTIVRRLAKEVNDYCADGNLIVCPVLTGAFIFAADLVRHLNSRCEVSFVRYVSYNGMQSTGNVRCELTFPEKVKGRDVLIVEDVIDSGLSMGKMIEEVRAMHPRNVRVCTLFFKPGSFKGNYKVDYVGKEIGDEFIVGYGMDYDEEGRTLPAVMVVNELG